MTHLACRLQWSEMSSSTRLHSSRRRTDRHKGPAGKNIKTALAGGKGEDTNRAMIRGAVSLCVTVCGGQKKGRGTQRGEGGSLQYDKRVGWKGSAVAACVADSDGR